MIAKISSSNSLAAVLGYNFKKVEKHEASVLLVQGLFQDRNGAYSRAQVLADMLRTIPERCRTKKTVFHCSLNPHPDEKLSDEALSRIAAEYMEALGYGAQPYIVFRHNDIPRTHIHIVSLRVDSEGRKNGERRTPRAGQPPTGQAQTDTSGILGAWAAESTRPLMATCIRFRQRSVLRTEGTHP